MYFQSINSCESAVFCLRAFLKLCKLISLCSFFFHLGKKSGSFRRSRVLSLANNISSVGISSISAFCSLTYTTPLPPQCSHVFWRCFRAWGWWNQGRRRRRGLVVVRGGQTPSAPLPFPLSDLSGTQPGSNVEMWLAGVDLIKSAHVSLQRGDSRSNHP